MRSSIRIQKRHLPLLLKRIRLYRAISTNADDANTLHVERTLDVIARAYATAVHQYFVGNSRADLPVPPPSQTTPKPPAPSPAPSLGKGTVVTELGVGAMLRAEPSTDAAVVQALPEAVVLNLVRLVNGEAIDGDKRWYRVRYEDDEGHVYPALVRTGGAAHLAAPLPTKAIGTGNDTDG